MNKLTTESLWASYSFPDCTALAEDLAVDVVVAGGGITGITTAYLLQREGMRVALLDRDEFVHGDTVRTSAHLTYVTDHRLHQLVKQWGANGARSFWEAGRVAIDQIEELAGETGADAGFRRVDGYLHLPCDPVTSERDLLKRDYDLAVELGFDASWSDAVPVMDTPGVRFARQAQINPRAYLAGLLQAFLAQGGLAFEHSAVDRVCDEPLSVSSNGRTIKCDYLVIATHNPLMGQRGPIAAALFQTKLALYTSYVVGANVEREESLAPALFWDTNDPYNYLRLHEQDERLYAIYGGGDVKTGHESNIADKYSQLARKLGQLLPRSQVERRWLGQVIEPADGLPYIGMNTPRQFIATGFSGNGLTLGTVAALLARDELLGKTNPWKDLFRTDRAPFHGGLWQYAKENVDYPYYLLRDRLKPAARVPVDELRSGEGKIISRDGRKVAAYRDDTGHLTLLDPACTHMKCLVRWNAADTTWDCPCHGSRFKPTGEVLSGPAESALEQLVAETAQR
jgi:glycine/D-amino acid oxidase-like deaminating enzyme/nitrite reductase/ring-hydroxylating ferredoxin subunit